MLGEKPTSANMVGLAARMAARAGASPEETFFDTEGIRVSEELKSRTVVVSDVEAKGRGLVEACLRAKEEGKDIVVVDSVSEFPRPPCDEGLVDRPKPLVERWEAKRRDETAAMAFLAAAGGWMEAADSSLMYGLTGRTYARSEPEPTKCGLPGCERKSVKDYCCSEHCREHRNMRKGSK